MASSILYKTEYKINDYITLKIPTVGDVIDHEDIYYDSVSWITATPFDMMAQLDDMNIDFTQITDWDLFCILFSELQTRDLSLIFKDIQLSDFTMAVNKQNGLIVFVNQSTGAVIDRAIHHEICKFLRTILCFEKNEKRPANEDAKKFMIERAKRKLRRRPKGNKSLLEDQIVALVNTPGFPYDYQSTLGLTIYQFNMSLRQVVKKDAYDKLMTGCYAGTININDLNPDELNWIN